MSAFTPVYVLGGAQTDFSRSWSREGSDLAAMIAEPVQGALVDAGVDATDVEVGHVANFGSEIYCGQGHLGGLFVEADPAFTGLPTSRHEAACASGSVAVLAAMADLEADRYDVACVVGVEMMRNVPTRRRGVEPRRGGLGSARDRRACRWCGPRCSPRWATSTTAATGSKRSTSARSLAAASRTRVATRTRRRAAGTCPPVRSRPTSTTTPSSRAGSAATTARRSPTAAPR